MPPIELGTTRPVGAADVRIARIAGAKQETAGKAPAAPGTLVSSQALDAGQAPLDTDRVQQVRKAVESGTYPLVPAKVADAIIAAGYLLRNPK